MIDKNFHSKLNRKTEVEMVGKFAFMNKLINLSINLIANGKSEINRSFQFECQFRT
jgi:hypothetical protein